MYNYLQLRTPFIIYPQRKELTKKFMKIKYKGNKIY